jgi:hypothetical protein
MGLGERIKRTGLVTVMAVLALNVFTGGPVLATWVGSRVQGEGPPTMAAFGVAALVLAATSYVLLRLLALTGRAHDRLVGGRPSVRTHLPWLRSMRGERPHEAGDQQSLSALEAILVLVVFLAVAAFEVWFVFFSTSPIDQRSGRG